MIRFSKHFPCFVLVPLLMTFLGGCVRSVDRVEGSEIFWSPSLSVDRPFWSKDARLIAFSGFDPADGNHHVVIMDISTLQETEVYKGPRTFVEGWSPLYNDELLISADGIVKSLQISAPYGERSITTGIGAAWSTDGTKLAVIERKNEFDKLKLWNSESEGESTLIDETSFEKVLDMSWSPDNKRLVFSALDSADKLTANLFMLDVAEKKIKQITSGQDGQQNINPVWINQDQLVFLQSNIHNYDAYFVIYDLTVGCVAKLQKQAVTSFSLSADLHSIIYTLENQRIELASASPLFEVKQENKCK
jgi:WD40 repeat protein